MFHLESLAAVHGCHNGCLCRGLEAMTPPPQICATIPRTRLNLQSGRCHDLINTCHANNRNRNEICKLYQSLQALFNPCVLDISWGHSWASWALSLQIHPLWKHLPGNKNISAMSSSHGELARCANQDPSGRVFLPCPDASTTKDNGRLWKIGTKYANKENKSDNNARNQQDK